MPRAVDVILTRRLCDCCNAGDKIIATCCLAAIPDVSSLLKPGEIPKSVNMERNKSLRSEYGMADNAVSGLREMGKFVKKRFGIKDPAYNNTLFFYVRIVCFHKYVR